MAVDAGRPRARMAKRPAHPGLSVAARALARRMPGWPRMAVAARRAPAGMIETPVDAGGMALGAGARPVVGGSNVARRAQSRRSRVNERPRHTRLLVAPFARAFDRGVRRALRVTGIAVGTVHGVREDERRPRRVACRALAAGDMWSLVARGASRARHEMTPGAVHGHVARQVRPAGINHRYRAVDRRQV